MNQFVQAYKDKIKQGKSVDQAYIDVSGKAMFFGTLDDVKDLYAHYVQDFADELMKELREDDLHETDQIAESNA